MALPTEKIFELKSNKNRFYVIATLFFLFVLMVSLVNNCQRISTGEVGLRVRFDKQVDTQELQPGTFNQTIIGSVLVFPVRDIAIPLDNMQPQTADHSTLADMDVTVIYSINPAAVGELYTTKSRSFHVEDERKDILLMFTYLQTVARSAAYKAVAKHEALKTVEMRDIIESEIVENLRKALAAEKLDTSLTITKVQVRNIQPAQSIIDSANEVITEQNRWHAKQVAVKTAQAEAERMQLMSRPQSLEYMKVQAQLNISQAVLEGKVQTIIIPFGATPIVNVHAKREE